MVLDNSSQKTLLICQSSGCISNRANEIKKEFEEQIFAQGLQNDVQVDFTGCHGFCAQGPIVIIEPEGIMYCQSKIEDIEEIVTSHLKNGHPVEKLFYENPETGQRIPRYQDIPFYKKQTRIVLNRCGHINPENIDDYIQNGGYSGLRKALKMAPEEIIEEIKKSGLRGRGGAGFPTGRKWEFCRKEKSPIKYIVCNGDEGDPGAYMDRSILEADPHSVVEGMIIGAYAIGAKEGYIYVRVEYPLAVKRFNKAIQVAEEYGFLGENILNSGFSFNIKIARGAGAFVCGEETALIASVEGRPIEPRLRPPYPTQCGLWGKPTTINNVETWANVPLIITRGGEWYSSLGTEKSKGTKVFSLVGKINNTGLVEVPMGISLREIIYEIGGGIPEGKKFKAIQTGGPSGGCIPESLIDLPVDYENLTEAGSIMGSGGMIVVDEDTCIVDLAKFFIDFTRDESCGKCNSCREGLNAAYEILNKIADGKGEYGDLEYLEDLSHTIRDFSMCGLGQTAPNPVLTTIQYFRDEYIAHIEKKECPAKVCKSLIELTIDPENCTGCGLCLRLCPNNAISGEKNEPHQINIDQCIKCGVCFDSCKFEAVIVKSGGN
ncbi:MAG: NADH-quinone oxidoreductase subunit NuoF [Promethearchaeota archaeon]